MFIVRLAATVTARSARVSELIFADLAGSESLSFAHGAGQQEETKAINRSLFALRNVMTALSDKEKFIPYRDSLLTMLLSRCLSGRARAAMIVTCSPEDHHGRFTQGALQFGRTSRRVVVRPTVGKRFGIGIGGKVVPKAQAAETVLDLDREARAAKAPRAEEKKRGPQLLRKPLRPAMTRRRMTLSGKREVSLLTSWSDDDDPHGPGGRETLVVCLHAFGSDCSAMDWSGAFGHLVEARYRVVALDFPGFGQSPGRRQSSRTEAMCNPGEAVETCTEVTLRILTEILGRPASEPVALFGWDWGGGIALNLAMLSGRPDCIAVKCVGLYHPSWTADKAMLAQVRQPVLMCWLPADQLHPYKNGQVSWVL